MSNVPMASQSGRHAPMAPNPGGMFLGMLQPDPADVEAVAAEIRRHLQIGTENLPDIERERRYQARYPLSLKQFCRYVPQQRQLAKELRSGFITSEEDTAALRGLLLRWRPEYTADFEGWTAYLKDMHVQLKDNWHKFERRSALPEAAREEHTLIVAPPKWGKSELMKSLAHHYTGSNSAAVVMLDPHTHMVEQVARWPELVRSNRAILIQPGLRGQVLSFNPLEARGLNESDKMEIASFWAAQFGALTSELSVPMRRLGLHCMMVLLSHENTTLIDLMELLNARKDQMTARQKKLYDLGRNYPDSLVSGFFRNDFLSSFFESTRNGLKSRIESILMMPGAREMLCVSGPFSLEQAIEERKFILVDLGAFGRDGGHAVGKLLVAMVGAIIRKRHSLPADQCTPTHLFVDEASVLVSDDMLANLKELRKFGLYSTLAQQIAADGFARENRSALFGITGCKFIGSDRGDVGGALQTSEKLPPIRKRQFWVKWSDEHRLECLTVRDDLAGNKGGVNESEWRDYVDRLLARYYRETAGLRLATNQPEPEPELGVKLYPHEAQQSAETEVPDHLIDRVMSQRAASPIEPRQVTKRQHGRRRRQPDAAPPA